MHHASWPHNWSTKPEVVGMTVLVSWSLNVCLITCRTKFQLPVPIHFRSDEHSIRGRTLQSPQSFPSADIRGIFSMTFRKQLPEERVMVRGFVPDLHVIEQKKISFLCHRVTTELPSNGDGAGSPLFICQHHRYSAAATVITRGACSVNSVPHTSRTVPHRRRLCASAT
jgi:hypothetical protein